MHRKFLSGAGSRYIQRHLLSYRDSLVLPYYLNFNLRFVRYTFLRNFNELSYIFKTPEICGVSLPQREFLVSIKVLRCNSIEINRSLKSKTVNGKCILYILGIFFKIY